MTWDDVWNLILGVGIGILIGGLLTIFYMEWKAKFCPTCGEIYEGDVMYCEHDGALLKERGN